MKITTLLNIFRFFWRISDKLDAIEQRLEVIDRNQVCGKTYLSKKEAAIYLDKTTNYVDNLIRGREISYFQPNGYAIYIARTELDKYITRTMFLSEEQIKARRKTKKA